MSQHSLDENIKQLEENLDTKHLRLGNNHGDFIHEFVFSKYLQWLQKLINEKLTVHFGFIKENRKSINEIDAEYHQLRNEFDALKADYQAYKTSTNSSLSSLSNRISNLENK